MELFKLVINPLFESSSAGIRDVVVAITSLIAIGLAWWRLKALNQSAAAGSKQAEISEQGLITDRMSKAVIEIYSDKNEEHLGAMYALERVAWDSPRDRPAIMEYLATYARSYKQVNLPLVNRDIALKILVEMHAQYRRNLGKNTRTNKISYLNLSNADLTKANLAGANLQSADLRGASLEEANLAGANLQSANLNRANLKKANLTEANLHGANLSNVDLMGANLSRSNLENSYLRKANLEAANLIKAKLVGTNLWGARLQHAILIKAKLRRTIFINTLMEGVDLTDIDLTDSSFEEVFFCGAWLKDAILSDEYRKIASDGGASKDVINNINRVNKMR